MKKYELTSESKTTPNGRLYRIRALRDFADVRAGDKGGWVSGERNLSHEGECWIYDEAKAWNHSRVNNNAKMRDYSQIRDYAGVFNNAELMDYVRMHDTTTMMDNSRMFGYATMMNYARMENYSILRSTGFLFNSMRLAGFALVESRSDVVGFSIGMHRHIPLTVYKTVTGIGATLDWKTGTYDEIEKEIKLYAQSAPNSGLSGILLNALSSARDHLQLSGEKHDKENDRYL